LILQIKFWGLQRTWIAQVSQCFLFVLTWSCIPAKFQIEIGPGLLEISVWSSSLPKFEPSKMQTSLDHNFGCGASMKLWSRIIIYQSVGHHWSGFEHSESRIGEVRFWCSHTLTWFGQTKMQTKLDHNFGCGASIRLWARIIIYHSAVDHWSWLELSGSPIRRVRFWHCFTGQIANDFVTTLLCFGRSLWEVNRARLDSVRPLSSWNSLGSSHLSWS